MRRTAPQTFPNRTVARRWLTLVEADIVRGVWRDPEAGTELLRSYAARWVAERDLSERTRELYRGLLDRRSRPTSVTSICSRSRRRRYGPGGRS